MEIWKMIPDRYYGDNVSTGYSISNLGRVRNDRTGRILKAFNDPKGALQVHLYVDKLRFCKKVHQLVAEEFVPNPEGKRYILHKDMDRQNNIPSNLQWADMKEAIAFNKLRRGK